jgi:hypothetical protein
MAMSSETVTRGTKVTAIVESLVDAHGATEATKLALTEQRKARRARSRKRFDFWAAVLSQIGQEAPGTPM